MTNHCGSCTQCCRLLGIQEISKPPGEWCPMCAIGKGCKVYEDRPPSCQAYECIWLASQSTDMPMPMEMRPDKSKVVLTPTEEGLITVHVDPGRKQAWQEGLMYEVIKTLAMTTKVIISPDQGTEKILLQNSGAGFAVTKKTITMTLPDKNGRQFYKTEEF